MYLFDNFDDLCQCKFEGKEFTLAQAERLAFIDYKLRCFGAVSRPDLINEFKIASAAASKDLALYRNIAPYNSKMDFSSKKTVIKSETFKPLIPIDGRTMLHFLHCGFCRNELETHYSKILIEVIEPKKEELLDPEHIALISRAIYRKNAIECLYHSANPESQPSRILFPTALFVSKNSWYLRAYQQDENPEKSQFKNFRISRFESINEDVGNIATNKQRIEQDIEWNTFVPLHLQIHPEHKNKSYVMKIHDLDSEETIITCRAALAFYYRVSLYIDVGNNKTGYYEFLLKNSHDLIKNNYTQQLFQ